jgi:hypothetical protein
MKIKLTYALFLLFLCSSFTSSEVKWGKTGHRTIGKIADNYLDDNIKNKIQKLLNMKSLAFTSTYADEIKSDKRYKEFYTWHYINMPLDSNYEDSEKNPKGDMVTGIAYCKKIITDKNSSDNDKAFYLKILIHLIGDLHQPMHVALAEDKGGNNVKLKWFGEDSNLHKVWDSEMINKYRMSYSELAENADVLTNEQVLAIQKGSIVDWVNETHQITTTIYATVNEGENLRYRYSYNHFNTVRTQLQIAGIRLAKVLNDLF